MIAEKILESLSEKSGEKITISDLTEEERGSLLDLERVMSKKEITLDDVRKFISKQLREAENQLLNFDNALGKDLYLKAVMRNYKMIKAFIASDETRKKALIGEIERAHGITFGGESDAPKKDVAKEKKAD